MTPLQIPQEVVLVVTDHENETQQQQDQQEEEEQQEVGMEDEESLLLLVTPHDNEKEGKLPSSVTTPTTPSYYGSIVVGTGTGQLHTKSNTATNQAHNIYNKYLTKYSKDNHDTHRTADTTTVVDPQTEAETSSSSSASSSSSSSSLPPPLLSRQNDNDNNDPNDLSTSVDDSTTSIVKQFSIWYCNCCELYPIWTKSVTAFCLLSFADFIAQCMEYEHLQYQHVDNVDVGSDVDGNVDGGNGNVDGDNNLTTTVLPASSTSFIVYFDVLRMLRFGAFGLIGTPWAHYYYVWLDTTLPSSTVDIGSGSDSRRDTEETNETNETDNLIVVMPTSSSSISLSSLPLPSPDPSSSSSSSSPTAATPPTTSTMEWILTLLMKVCIDQFIQAPLLLACIIIGLGIMSGETPNQWWNDLQLQYWSTLLANWKLWIPAMIINIAFVHPMFRVLYDNIIFFGWTIFLSITLNN